MARSSDSYRGSPEREAFVARLRESAGKLVLVERDVITVLISEVIKKRKMSAANIDIAQLTDDVQSAIAVSVTVMEPRNLTRFINDKDYRKDIFYYRIFDLLDTLSSRAVREGVVTAFVETSAPREDDMGPRVESALDKEKILRIIPEPDRTRMRFIWDGVLAGRTLKEIGVNLAKVEGREMPFSEGRINQMYAEIAKRYLAGSFPEIPRAIGGFCKALGIK